MNKLNDNTVPQVSTVDLIALISVPQIGNTRAMELINTFGSTKELFSAPARELSKSINLPLEVGKGIVEADKDRDKFEKLVSKAKSDQINIVTYWDDNYPKRLKSIPNPPALLYIRGQASPLYDYAVAMVGTRAASSHGKNIALRIASQLAKAGITIVSGMALGIDSASHVGALRAGGRTIAVLGCGTNVIYPPSNRKIYDQIVQQGAIISEYPPDTTPETHHFPQRNRIISGLSLGVIIIEAGLKSGALITADLASEQGREVFAVPGQAGMRWTAGTNNLIRQGVPLVETADEVVEHLKSQLAPITNISASLILPDMSEEEDKIYQLLENGPRLIDELIRETKLNALGMNRLLTSLQLKGVIQQLPGARVGRS